MELDRGVRLPEQHLRCGVRTRDDTGYQRRFQPDVTVDSGRW